MVTRVRINAANKGDPTRVLLVSQEEAQAMMFDFVSDAEDLSSTIQEGANGEALETCNDMIIALEALRDYLQPNEIPNEQEDSSNG